MKAVILAGGEGTRLRPLTSNQPKPMMPLVNRPMLEHIVALLDKHGFDDIVVTVAYLGNQIRDVVQARAALRAKARVGGCALAALGADHCEHRAALRALERIGGVLVLAAVAARQFGTVRSSSRTVYT